MSDRDDLQRRAYRQGRERGALGRSIHLADWEPEFQAKYLEGYRAGKLVLEQSVRWDG